MEKKFNKIIQEIVEVFEVPADGIWTYYDDETKQMYFDCFYFFGGIISEKEITNTIYSVIEVSFYSSIQPAAAAHTALKLESICDIIEIMENYYYKDEDILWGREADNLFTDELKQMFVNQYLEEQKFLGEATHKKEYLC